MVLIELNPRDPTEAHRVATPLELMFDLAAVIAIASAAVGLHHGIIENHVIESLGGFLLSFFMIWWSWMNYTWFASAYDNDSDGFRVVSMIAMFGALTIAAGIPAVYANEPIHLCLMGFVVMRLAMAFFWFAASLSDRSHRKTALVYTIGIVLLQTYWIVTISSVPPSDAVYPVLLLAGIIGELAVPVIAELGVARTTWHRHHIVERYGLLNIIVLGECFLGVVAILGGDGHESSISMSRVLMGLAFAVITFSMWVLYFSRGGHLEVTELRHALLWGYGHFFIFASGAAIGSGFAVLLDVSTGHAEVDNQIPILAISVPIAVYLIVLWLIRDVFLFSGLRTLTLPIGAIVVLAASFIHTGGLMAITLAIFTTAAARSLLLPQAMGSAKRLAE